MRLPPGTRAGGSDAESVAGKLPRVPEQGRPGSWSSAGLGAVGRTQTEPRDVRIYFGGRKSVILKELTCLSLPLSKILCDCSLTFPRLITTTLTFTGISCENPQSKELSLIRLGLTSSLHASSGRDIATGCLSGVWEWVEGKGLTELPDDSKPFSKLASAGGPDNVPSNISNIEERMNIRNGKIESVRIYTKKEKGHK